MSRSRVCNAGGTLLLGVFAMVAVVSITPAIAFDVPPEEKVRLAYDQPLPDSVKRGITELTVIDAETKAPIAVAEVLVLNYVDLRFHRFPTSRQGRLRFAYPYADKPAASLEIRKEGYVPQRCSWGFEKEPIEAPRQVTIALRRGVEIGGLIVDEAGQQIEGVTVVVSVDEYAPGGRLKDARAMEMLYEVPFQTGRDGRWRTASCPPTATKLALQLIHSEFVSGGCQTLAGPGLRHPPTDALRKQTDRQVMIKGVRMSGRVTDMENKPIPGARVSDSTQGMTFLTYIRNAETDLDGRFHLHFEPGEKLKLTVQANGFEPVTTAITATPDQTAVDFRLESGKVIRGRVVDQDGKPISGAGIIIPRFTKQEGVFLRTWTNQDGRFVWGSAPSGSVELSIWKEGYLGIDRSSFSSGEETVAVMRPGLTVLFKAVDARSRQAIKEFTIDTGLVDPATGTLAWKPPAMGGRDGECRTTLDATKAPYQFLVRAEGYRESLTRILNGGEKDVEIVIELQPKERR